MSNKHSVLYVSTVQYINCDHSMTQSWGTEQVRLKSLFSPQTNGVCVHVCIMTESLGKDVRCTHFSLHSSAGRAGASGTAAWMHLL